MVIDPGHVIVSHGLKIHMINNYDAIGTMGATMDYGPMNGIYRL